MKKLVITGVVLVVALGSFFYNFINRTTNLNTGVMTIVVVDSIGDTVHNDEIVFAVGDTLFEIMNGEYDLQCANNQYQPGTCDSTPFFGRVVMSIDEVQTDWSNNYLAIYVNNSYSNYGIDDIPLEDETEYRFEYTVVGDED